MSDLQKIHAFADGQLDESQKAEVIKEIADCPQSKAEYEAVLLVKGTLKRHCTGVPCDETLMRIQRRIDAIDRSARTEALVGRYAYGLCGLFLVLIIGAGLLNRSSIGQGEPTGYAMSAPLLTPADVGPGSIQSWLRSKFGREPVAIPQEKLVIRGAASAYFNGNTVVRLDLADQRGPLQLVIIGKIDDIQSAENGRQFIDRHFEDGDCVEWRDQGYQLFLMAPRSSEELQRIALLIRIGPSSN